MSPDKLVLNTGQGLSKDYSRTTEYYYDYKYTDTKYQHAQEVCMNRGPGWRLASFQALIIQPEIRVTNTTIIVRNAYYQEYEANNYYNISVANVRLVDQNY